VEPVNYTYLLGYPWPCLFLGSASDHGDLRYRLSRRLIISWRTMFLHHSLILVQQAQIDLHFVIQGNGNVTTTTTTLPLSYVFYLPCFPYNHFSASKITKILNCTVIFFLTHCVFPDLVTRKTIGIWRKQNDMYELELASNQVDCINTLSAFDYHCRLGHSSLPVLKLLILSLGRLSSSECESCQLGKHHRILS
jgi:hypothetical protein